MSLDRCAKVLDAWPGLCHKRQSRRSFPLLTAFNQNVLEVRMSDDNYSSIIWLSQGKYAIVDNEDYDFLNQWKWHANCGYALRKIKAQCKSRQKALAMHRFINNTPEGLLTDHIKGRTLDNRKSNLRICSGAENQHNQRLSAANTSGLKGVRWNKKLRKWQTGINVNKKAVYLGLYENKTEAAIAFDKAAVKHHGEFAKTNKMLGLL